MQPPHTQREVDPAANPGLWTELWAPYFWSSITVLKQSNNKVSLQVLQTGLQPAKWLFGPSTTALKHFD